MRQKMPSGEDGSRQKGGADRWMGRWLSGREEQNEKCVGWMADQNQHAQTTGPRKPSIQTDINDNESGRGKHVMNCHAAVEEYC